jgi:DNA-binding SARP family transcriptional activator
VDQFSLRLLGGFAVHHGDRPVDVPPACRRLIALVALKRRPVHRLWVCATLWPHAQTRRAEASLRSALWRVRGPGADALLTVDPQYLQLSPDVSVDWHRSVHLIERLLDGDIDAPLVSELLPLLRRGELLDKWAERWVSQDRDRYHTARVSAIETLGHTHEKHLPHHGRSAVRPLHARQPMTSSDTTEPTSS